MHAENNQINPRTICLQSTWCTFTYFKLNMGQQPKLYFSYSLITKDYISYKLEEIITHTLFGNQDVTAITAAIKPQTGNCVRTKAVLIRSPRDTVTLNGRRPGVLAVM